MTNGGPGHATEILVTYIYKLAFNETRFDYAAAITVVFFLLLLAVTWVANRLSGGNVALACATSDSCARTSVRAAPPTSN